MTVLVEAQAHACMGASSSMQAYLAIGELSCAIHGQYTVDASCQHPCTGLLQGLHLARREMEFLLGLMEGLRVKGDHRISYRN